MEDSGYGQRLCLKLGGTNERTSSKAELVEVQRANVRRWCAGMCSADYSWDRWLAVYRADAMLNNPAVIGSEL